MLDLSLYTYTYKQTWVHTNYIYICLFIHIYTYLWLVDGMVYYLVLSNIFFTSKQMELLKWPNWTIFLSVFLLKPGTLKYHYITWSTNIYEFLDALLYLSRLYILANVTSNLMPRPYLSVPISHVLSQSYRLQGLLWVRALLCSFRIPLYHTILHLRTIFCCFRTIFFWSTRTMMSAECGTLEALEKTMHLKQESSALPS